MTFRERMNSAESNAEYQILNELTIRGLGKHLESSVAGGGHGFHFIYQMDGCFGCVPDFYYGSRHQLAIFIDGTVHIRREPTDLLIDEALKRRGIRVLRFPYNPPLRKSRLIEIVDEIEENLNGKS